MNTTLEILNIRLTGITDLEKDSCWYRYEAKQEEKNLESFIIMPNGLSDEEQRKTIEKHIQERGFDKFVPLNSVSGRLKELIKNCHGSEEEMWFAELDDEDWNELSEAEHQELAEEIHSLELSKYIEMFYDLRDEPIDTLITVYGGIGSVVNFN